MTDCQQAKWRTTVSKPTFAQTEHFYRLVSEGKITSDNFQLFLENRDINFITEMTVGGRTYEIIDLLILESVRSRVIDEFGIVGLAKEKNACLGEEDGEHILTHQDEIPRSLRGRIVFVFTDWKRYDDLNKVYFVSLGSERWIRYWDRLVDGWDSRTRVLRRKS